MIGKVFAGSKVLFEEAIDDNEIYQSDEDGLWYFDKTQRKRKETWSQGASATEECDASSTEAMQKALACLVDDMQEGKASSAWLAVEVPQKRGKQVAALPAAASAQDMSMQQDRLCRISSLLALTSSTPVELHHC